MFFVLKKIVSITLYPLSLCLTALVIGLLLTWLSSKKQAGKIIVSLAVLILIIFSFGFLSNSMLHSLESQYSPLMDFSRLDGVKWIAVLGGGHVSNSIYPANEQLSVSSLTRLIEGIRIHKSLSGSRLILSGGAVFDPVPEATVMAAAALEMGVSLENIIQERTSKDTEDQALNIKKLINFNPKQKFVLVTSALHMPRAIALFKKYGMKPIAAPVGFLVKNPRGRNPYRYFPNASNIKNLERVFHEYLGLAWTELKAKSEGNRE